ncbi:MAG: hypothetical protein Q9164_007900 [Protoblastenia rupestris]
MSPAGRQLRKRKDVHYRIPPPPRLPSDRRKKPGMRTKRRAISGCTAKKSVQPVTPTVRQSSAGGAAMAVNDDSIFTSSQVRKAEHLTAFRKDVLKLLCGLLNLASMIVSLQLSSPFQQTGKDRSTVSPATEAAIHQIPQEIEKAITYLKSIKNVVEGLLEFKVILDLEAARVLPDVGRHQATGSHWITD